MKRVWAVLLLTSCFSAPRYIGPQSDHFDGDRFFTPGAPKPTRGFSSFLKWQLEGETGPWKDYREEPYGAPPPARVGAGELRITFINHATTLIQLDGVNLLTDPVYADRVSPVSFAGPHRVRPPGIRFEDLPAIDAVVISHNHYDHMDVATLLKLQQAFPKLRIYAGLGNKRFLESKGLNAVSEMDWWQQTQLGATAVKLTSVPTQHFSNRGLTDEEGTLWTGWVAEGTNGRVYFAGDTAYGPHFASVGEKLGPFRLAVLPIGAYLPEWFMSPVHMTPKDAVKATAELRAGIMVPMHYGTFPLADDAEDQAPNELREAAAGDERFWILGFGEGRAVP